MIRIRNIQHRNRHATADLAPFSGILPNYQRMLQRTRIDKMSTNSCVQKAAHGQNVHSHLQNFLQRLTGICQSASGSQMVNSVPFPGVLVTSRKPL